jgi:hypothetical protein
MSVRHDIKQFAELFRRIRVDKRVGADCLGLL